MVTRLIRSLGILCLFVTAAIGSDQPNRNTPPIPSRVKGEHTQKPPLSPEAVGGVISSTDHLRRAASHLEAAAEGEHTERFLRQAAELRMTADRLEVQRKHRLGELRQQAAEIQRQIHELEGDAQTPPLLEVQFKVVEIDLAQLKRLGFQWETFPSNDQEVISQTVATSDMPEMLDTIPTEVLNGFLTGLV